MDSRELDYDPILKRRRIYHHDRHDGTIVLESVTDVTDVEENAKGFNNLFDERSRWSNDFNLVATIPIGLYFELDQKGIARDEAAMKKWLNDRDNRVFRTRPGRV